MDDIVTKGHFQYYDVALVNKFWNYWQLDNAIASGRDTDVPLSSIARLLTINRCVNPESKSAIGKWFETTSLPQLLGIDAQKINKSRLFRDLSGIEDNKDAVCNHLLEQYKQRFPAGLSEVYYDLSSTQRSAAQNVLSPNTGAARRVIRHMWSWLC